MKNFISLLIILSACVNPFILNEDEYDHLLVVEGFVSTHLKDSEIRISYSDKFKTTMFEMVSGAQVEVLENNSIKHSFAEKEPGLYVPADTNFVADMQSVYSLQIKVDNKVYKSSDVSIKRSAEISGLDFITTDKYLAGEKIKYRALDILVTTVEDPDASKYYRYSVDETWLVTATDSLNQRFRPEFILDNRGWPIDVKWNVESNIASTYCWAHSHVRGVYTYSTEGLIRNQLVNVPVFGVSLENIKLLHKYSALIRQYSIPKEAHLFISLMHQFSQNDVALFETQPGFVEGNLKCLSDESEKVIGIFYASDVVEKRIFIRFFDLPTPDRMIVLQHAMVCPSGVVEIPTTEGIDKLPALLYLRDSLLYDKGYVVANVLSQPESELVQCTYEYCIDCRVMGSNVKPDFWGSIFY